MNNKFIIAIFICLVLAATLTSYIHASKQEVPTKAIEYLYHSVKLLNSLGGAGDVDSVSVKYLSKIDVKSIKVNSTLSRDSNIKLSIKLLEKALNISPNFDEAHHFLGVAFLLKSDISNAVKSFEKATHFDVKKESAYYYLFMLYPKLDKFSEGHDLVRKFKVLFPKSAHKGDLYNATIYFNEKKYREAITIAKSVLREYPNEISSLYIIGNSHLMLFEDKKANNYYSQIVKISPDQMLQVQSTKDTLLKKRKQ